MSALAVDRGTLHDALIERHVVLANDTASLYLRTAASLERDREESFSEIRKRELIRPDGHTHRTKSHISITLDDRHTCDRFITLDGYRHLSSFHL